MPSIGSVSSSNANFGLVLQGEIGGNLASRGRLLSSFPSSPKNPPTITVTGKSCPRSVGRDLNKTLEMILAKNVRVSLVLKYDARKLVGHDR